METRASPTHQTMLIGTQMDQVLLHPQHHTMFKHLETKITKIKLLTIILRKRQIRDQVQQLQQQIDLEVMELRQKIEIGTYQRPRLHNLHLRMEIRMPIGPSVIT